MRPVAPLVFAAICCTALPASALGQQDLPKMSDGYEHSPRPDDKLESAPAGYFGLTDIYHAHNVSASPATAGVSYVTDVTMSNKVQSCPQADGTVEGDGEISGSIDLTKIPQGLTYNSPQTGTTSKLIVKMTAKAKYKGQVGDDSRMKGPVNADIQYTFSENGYTREQSGALTSPSESHFSQHISIQFAPDLGKAPVLGDMQGGNPFDGNLDQARSVAQILAFFGGVYYGAAYANWTTPDSCAHVVFNPPSKTRSPTLGSDTKVTAEIKTKSGGGARGTFSEVRAHKGGGAVASVDESTDPGSPAIFTYTAPTTQVDNAGFHLGGTSRAGTVAADWDTGLGTDWSGQINASLIIDGDAGNSDLQSWSYAEATRISIDLENGVGKATGFTEIHAISENRHYVVVGGSAHLEPLDNDNTQGSAESTTKATVSVDIDRAAGRYMIRVDHPPFQQGTRNSTSCQRGKCTSKSDPEYIALTSDIPLAGKLTDLNHLSGGKTEISHGQGHSGKGTATLSVTWDLARKGDTQ